MKIKDLLVSKDQWTQQACARTKAGDVTGPDNSEAVCWCLYGALVHCYPEPQERTVARTAIDTVLGKGVAIVAWNDKPERTFKEVKDLVIKLNI